MKRKALLLYLQNVRDLEVAKFRLSSNYQKDYSSYTARKAALCRTPIQYDLPDKPEEHTISIVLIFLGILLFLSFPVLMLIGFFTEREESLSLLSDPFILFMLIISIAVVIVLFFLLHSTISSEVREVEQWKQEVADIKAKNEQNNIDYKNRNSALPVLEKNWTNRVHWYQKELQKVNALLNSFYRMNILPNQYRNLPSVLYIYDYMSSSSATFEDTLIHEHMENGIQRLEAKLDTIIGQLEDILYETRCMRAENQRAIQHTIQQNNQMLQSLQRTEQNTLASAQYAELAANYSKANAYLSLATYLKR